LKVAAFEVPTTRVAPSVHTLVALQLVASIYLMLFVVPAMFGQKLRPTQYDVEAAYLVQFPKFVTWPSALGGQGHAKSFAICVLGQDPYGRILVNAVAGERIDGLPLVARVVASAQSAADCRVLFVSSSEEDHLAGDLAVLNNAPVLTVSELPGFTLRGGMIEFVLTRHRVRFRINATSAERAGLKVSSQLLKVALSVDPNPGSSQ
jgi:YfiR/HmsC-like